MPTTETLPAIDDCIDLYVQVHDLYGADVFDPDDMSRRVRTRVAGTDLPTDVRSLTRLLDLLCAYGLLDRHHDGRYQVRCAPDESLDRWRAKTATRVESLHHRVDRATNPARDEPTGDSGRATLRHEGDAFASVRVSHPGDLDSARADIPTAMDEHPECAGIVLRSPGELAAAVQRFADELCDPEATASGVSAFEKVTTDLVGDDKNDLEFRLFLREVA